MSLLRQCVISLLVACCLMPAVTFAVETLIILSMDGFRYDYIERGATPTMMQLAEGGVRAKYMSSIFPTKTFPNHYSIATGLYAETHGIVSNTFYDPNLDAYFRISDPDAVGDARFWGGEPIWNTVEKQGQKSGCCYWPGSEAPIQGIRPSYWLPYDGSFPNEDRVELVLEWLALPAAQRPNFITLYFSIVDDYGHSYGPDSPMIAESLIEVDGLIQMLIDGLKELNIYETTHLIVCADHGMATTSRNRVILIDDYIDLDHVEIVDWSPITAIIPDAGYEDEVYRNLSDASTGNHFEVYQKNGTGTPIPSRYHYTHNDRITPILLVAENEYSVTDRASYNRNPGYYDGGTHGYDNEELDMQSMFIATGPKFKKNTVIDPFPNVDVYNLLARILDLVPAPNEGNPDSSLIHQSLINP